MSPWSTAKTDLEKTGRTLYVALQAISGLKILWSPVLPFTSQKLHELLGETSSLFGQQLVETYTELSGEHTVLTYDGSNAKGGWSREPVPVGRQLPKPKPLFKRLEPEIADQEISRMGN